MGSMKNDKITNKNKDFHLLMLLDFEWLSFVTIKDKNGKLSWLKVCSVLILILLTLPFILAEYNS
jgi:hypothetical protein